MVNNVDDKSALSKGVKEAFSGLHVDTKRVNELVSTLETATKESREYE
jgi:hypothetical protein